MKKQSYYQGTADPKEKRKPDELPTSRVDLDVRNPNTFTHFRNYDYTDEGPNETSPGGGLYHGSMDRFKSVKDFLDKRRKEMKIRSERSLKRSALLLSLVTKVG
jgi:hypothetical protein